MSNFLSDILNHDESPVLMDNVLLGVPAADHSHFTAGFGYSDDLGANYDCPGMPIDNHALHAIIPHLDHPALTPQYYWPRREPSSNYSLLAQPRLPTLSPPSSSPTPPPAHALLDSRSTGSSQDGDGSQVVSTHTCTKFTAKDLTKLMAAVCDLL